MNEQKGGSPKSKAGLYVTLLVILMTIALVAAIAGAVARSTRGNESVTTAETTAMQDGDTTAARQDDVLDTDDAFVTEKETTSYDEKAEKDSSAQTKETEEPENVLPEFANPTDGSLMKEYSNETPVFSLTMDDYRTHSGIDIAANIGENVKVVADGVINEVWDDPMMGKCVSVNHSGGAVSTYKNLNDNLSENIEKGISVSCGTVLGTVGESALEEIAEEPHLHFELSINSKSVNPSDYLNFSAAAAAYEG